MINSFNSPDTLRNAYDSAQTLVAVALGIIQEFK